MNLDELGWTEHFAHAMPEGALEPARVASVYSARVDVWAERGPLQVSLRSRVLREVEGGIAVGDWVAIAKTEGEDSVVEHVLPRRTAFLRQAAGERSEPQAIAANIDRVFIVTSPEEFNVRRLERYLVAIRAGGAEAEIILTKADLDVDLEALTREANALAPTTITSARTGVGLDDLRARIPKGVTVALAGSSGVGKSALVNRLLGRDVQLEGAVREHDKRGRHTTTRRELFVVPGGGLLVDTPGMRELKPWQAREDESTFDDVIAIANDCRYRDCQHAGEPGCAVVLAIENGTLDAGRVESWRKLEMERMERTPLQEAHAASEAKRRGRIMSSALRKRLREKGR